MINYLIVLYAIARHPLRAVNALYWRLMGKKKRARNKFGLIFVDSQSSYRTWMMYNEDHSKSAKNVAVFSMNSFCKKPQFVVIIEGSSDHEETTLHSLKAQWYENWTIDEPNTSLCEEQDIYYCIVKSGDTLSPDAFYCLAEDVNSRKTTPVCIYSDEDYSTIKGTRFNPHFKPCWNYELFRSIDYVGGLCVVHGSLLPTGNLKFSSSMKYSVLYGFSDKGLDEGPVHISRVLYHRYWEGRAPLWPKSIPLRKEEAEYVRYSTENLENAKIETVMLSPNVKYSVLRREYCDFKPLVSIIIPTRDMVGLLKCCVDSIVETTNFPNYEILIIDNDSHKKETIDYFNSLKCQPNIQVLKYAGTFNYSAINNFAVDNAKGDFICLLNNDTRVINAEWLDELLAYGVMENIGAVGAKLLYEDGRIQHAGVYTGLGGLAGHGHRFLKDVDSGYFYRAHLPQYVSAVTAACLLIKKSKFIEVGGLDEKNLLVAFNDVDFCLKLDALGYNNVYTPHAKLYHYESKSRGKDLKGAKRERYLREVEFIQNKWQTDKKIDRYYSPNLTAAKEDFTIKVNY